MVIDIISYKLAEGITEDFLRKSAEDIFEIWMKKQKGLLGWDINKSKDGLVDFVYWETQEDVDNAAANMKDIPQGHDWMKCYDMASVKTQKVNTLLSFKS